MVVINTQNKAIALAKGQFFILRQRMISFYQFFKQCADTLRLYPKCGLVYGEAALINTKNEFLNIRPRLCSFKKVKFFLSQVDKITIFKY